MAKNKLTKAEIIENIYENVDVNKKDIHNIIDLMFEEIKNGLIADKIVAVVGKSTILYSDIEEQYLQYKAQKQLSTESFLKILTLLF